MALILKSKLCLLILLLSVIALNVAFAKKDPELKQCKHQCRHQEGFDDQQKQKCERDCEEYIKQKEEIERQKEKGKEGHLDTWVGTREGRVQVLPKFTKRSNLLSDIERLFGQQKLGSIIKVSKEQIQGLREGGSGIWPFGSESANKEIEGIARELAFNLPNKEVDRIFGNQE